MIFVPLLVAATSTSLGPATAPGLPLQHYVAAPLGRVHQTMKCFGRSLSLDGANDGTGFKILAMHGFLGDTSPSAVARINGRLNALKNVVKVSVSCAQDGEFMDIEAAPADPGRNLTLSVYLMKDGVAFFPID